MAVFVVPPSAGSKKENRFSFKLGTKTYSVPKLQYLSGKTAKMLTETTDQLTVAEINRRIFISECPSLEEAVYDLADDQVNALADAWVEESAITPGESEASEDS